jgi:hypothetical protein
MSLRNHDLRPTNYLLPKEHFPGALAQVELRTCADPRIQESGKGDTDAKDVPWPLKHNDKLQRRLRGTSWPAVSGKVNVIVLRVFAYFSP